MTKRDIKFRYFSFRCILVLVLLLGVVGVKAADYVITYTNGGTTYYVGMDGNSIAVKTEFDPTCVWTCRNGNNEANLANNASYSLRNKNNNTYYLTTSCSRSGYYYYTYTWAALTVQNNANNIWRSNNGNVYAYYSGSGYNAWNRSASIRVVNNAWAMYDNNTTASQNYQVTTTDIAATLTSVILSGDETLSTTGEYSYSISGTYTPASINYRFNNADHYVPVRTPETVTPTGTWTVSGTGASYVSVDAGTGTITVNSIPTDADKTITLSCTPSYNGTTGTTVTKTITLRAGCATPTFSFDNSNNQVTLTSATAGATIYYTTDGSTPTTSSTVYSAPFEQNTAATIKAIAVKSGVGDSEVGTYSVVKLPTPYAVNNAAGNAVTFTSSEEGVTFYYTYGNYDSGGEFADPTVSSSSWHTGDAAVSIPTENVVKVMTAKPATATTGYINSDVYSRRVNSTDMAERKLVIMYNAGTASSPDVHFLANNSGSVQNTTTFNPSTCIWDALPFANPTPVDKATAWLGSNMAYEPFVRFRNNGRYLQLHAGPSDFNNYGWQDWVRLTPSVRADEDVVKNLSGVEEDPAMYYYPHYVDAQGSIINAAHLDLTEAVQSGANSFQLGYNAGKWQRYAAKGLALYNNSQFSVYYPVEEHPGGGFLLNVTYPSGYETTKEELSKGQSVTILSNITGADGTGTGTYSLPYYRVGNEVTYFYYYVNSNTPMTTEPTPSTDIRITYELLNGTDYLDVDDATHTYTLIKDPGRDLYVTVRVTATPYIDGEPQPDGIQTKDYQFHILTMPPFPAPVISRVEGTNDYQMECTASNAKIEYQLYNEDGTPYASGDYSDAESADHAGWYVYDGPITIVKVGTVIRARSYRKSDSSLSDPVDYHIGGAMLLSPVITVDNSTGGVTIAPNGSNSSLPDYTTETILYTVNGSIPDPENVGGDNPTQTYTAGFTVDNGQTITAIAIATGFTNSAPSTAVYKVTSGVDVMKGVITLNDYEDHTWSYYQAAADLPDGYPDQLHSPYPRNVQITYYGYGDNTLSTSKVQAPAASTFTNNTTSLDVKVGIGEEGHTFLYYKTLERDGGGRYPYELIPNPFYVRPDYRSGTDSEHTIKVEMNDQGGNGWNGQLLADFSDGQSTETIQLSSGSSGTKTFTVSAGVKVRLTWVEGNDNSEVSFTVRYYDSNVNGDVIYTVNRGDLTRSEPLTTFTVKGLSNIIYTGFYKWRVRKIEGGSIYSASTGGTQLATESTVSSDNVMLDAENTYYFVPADAGETNANNATSMKVDLEALWAPAGISTSGTFSNTAGADNYNYNSVERNFTVTRSGTSTNVFGSSTPCTYSSFYPNGTTDGTTAATLTDRLSIGISNPSAASKVEYYIISGNNSTMNAGGRNITIGRGVEASGTYVAQTVYGANANATNLNYRLRLESGTYQNFYMTGAGRTYSGVVSAKAILGSDYDRVKGDNSKLSIAASEGNIYGGTTLTFSGSGNRNNLTFDWNVKSGSFHSGITGNASGGTETIYLGSSQAGNGNLQYIGKRRIIVEGGNLAGIAGAMNNASATYGVNDGTWCVMIRVKGGTMRTSIYGAAAFAQAVGDRVMILTGGSVNGWIAGGCNGTQTGSGGTMNGDSKIYVGGNAKVQHTTDDPTISTSRGGNVFGAGSGYSADYEIGEVQNSNVVVADNAEISRSVYGGGNYGYVGTGYTTNMFILGGKMANVFGGANQRFGQTVNITMTGGLVTDGLYGGSNVSGNINNDVTIKINGGQVGTDVDHIGYVHGGGLGNNTRVLGSVNMTIGESAGAEKYVTVYGDVYGGSAQGRTNGNTSRTSGAVTNVTLNAGKIYGSLYGGGLGTAAYAADVYGPVQVTVNGGGIHATVQDGSGAVYGCNNINGAPQSTVKVDITGTDDPADGRKYALDAVYGGGNKASYTGTPEVTVHNCENSIEYVYGGGNAANVSGTKVKIYGGNEIGTVFGGGNGTVNAANVTTSGVDLDIYGGTIGHVYGGNNTSGTITGAIDINIDKQTESGHSSCLMKIGEVYGGGNMAPSQAGTIQINRTGDIANNEGIGDVYGGANKADITSGNITLNINGGIINRIFGANNNSGDIVSGTITINVNKTVDADWKIGDIFGGGNQAAYTAPAGGENHPLINLTNGDVEGSVYGGGYGDPADKSKGTVTGNPQILISGSTVKGNVYGGGNMADMVGSVKIEVSDGAAGGVEGDIYGGGALANTGNLTTPSSCTTVIDLKGGTVHNVYGGGLGDAETAALVGSNVTVTLDGSAVTGQIFGCNNVNGTPLGHVKVLVEKTAGWAGHDVTAGKNDDSVEKTGAVYELDAVYGGGNQAAYEPKNSNDYAEVIINGCKLTSIGSVYGGGNAACVPATSVTVNGTYEIGYVFGGGNGKDKIMVDGVEKDNPGANVGYYTYEFDNTTGEVLSGTKTEYGTGQAQTFVYGGTVHHVFGGSNTKGNIREIAVTTLDEADALCPLDIGEIYAGGNEAYMDGAARLVLGCITALSELYGGSKKANVGGDINLTITSGHFDRVFGGNNESGEIKGSITVNIEETGCKPITIGELYGCGNKASYTTPVGKSDPVINAISFTSIGRIFGGGLGTTATVTGNPVVNINEIKGLQAGQGTAYAGVKIDYADGTSVTLPAQRLNQIGTVGTVFGGGNQAKVVGNTTVNVGTAETVEMKSLTVDKIKTVEGVNIQNNVYGGGNNADVTGSTNVNIGR